MMSACSIDGLEDSTLGSQTPVPLAAPFLPPTRTLYPEWFIEARRYFEPHFKRVIAGIAARPGLGRLVPDAVNPGRRIRPTLYCALWQAAHQGFPDETDLLPPLALELFHAASIVLDDMADREENRRGKKPFFRIHDVDTAVLVSHLLMAEGERLLSCHPHGTTLLKAWMESYLAAADGQAFSIRRFDGFSIDEHYFRSLAKTSSFFIFIADAFEKCAHVPVSALTSSMKEVGECFQISNDIVDLLFLQESHRHDPTRSYPLRPSAVIIHLASIGIIDESEIFDLLPFSRHLEISDAAKLLIPDAEAFLRQSFLPVETRLLQETCVDGHNALLSDFLDCATSPLFWLHGHG